MNEIKRVLSDIFLFKNLQNDQMEAQQPARIGIKLAATKLRIAINLHGSNESIEGKTNSTTKNRLVGNRLEFNSFSLNKDMTWLGPINRGFEGPNGSQGFTGSSQGTSDSELREMRI